MSRDHSPQHEEALAALLAEEGEPAALLRRVEGCAECERRLEELLPIAELVHLAGQGGGLAADALPPFEAGEQAARRRLEELAGIAAPAAPERPRSRAALLLTLGLAAAAVLAFFLLRSERSRTSGDDLLIGGSIEWLAPQASAVAPSDLEFRWEGELGPGEEYVLHVQDQDGLELEGSPMHTDAPRWRPPPELMAAWPERLRAMVSVELLGEPERRSEWKLVRLAR